jgi:hypothetical protein
VKVTGRRNFLTNSIHHTSMMLEAYLAWQIRGVTPILLNCNLNFIWLVLMASFITYRPVPHLDRKHTVFGKVVGGLEILEKFEAIPTNHDEKPEQDIKINKLLIFVDPFDVLSLKDIA